MARGTSAHKKNSRGKTGASGRGRKNTRQYDGLSGEIIVIAVAAFAVLLLLSDLGFAGDLGGFISDLSFGIFGLVSYIFPIMLVIMTVFYVKNKGTAPTALKMWSGLLILLVLCAFAHLLFFPHDRETTKLTDYYVLCRGIKNGGGFIGGAIGSALDKGLGRAGAYIVLIVLLIIAGILITERSLIGSVERGSKTLIDNAKNDIERAKIRRMEERPIREEQRRNRLKEKEVRRREEEQLRLQKANERNEKLRQRDLAKLQRRQEAERIREENLRKKEAGLPRMDRKFSGVMLDTELKSLNDGPVINDDIHELSYRFPAGDDPGEIPGFDTADEDTGRIDPDVLKHENKLGYDNVKSSHTINVDPDGIDVNEYDYNVTSKALMPDMSDMAEEAKFGNFKSEDDVNRQKAVKASVDEYMKPSVNVGEQNGTVIDKKQNVNTAKDNRRTKIRDFKFPPVNLLVKGSGNGKGDSKLVLEEKARKLKETLREFGVGVTMTGYTQGPAITRFEMRPDTGVKVSKVLGLSDDIMLSMAAKNVRIEAPIPGKSLIGIELPNEENTAVMLRDLIDSQEFKRSDSKLSFAVGKGLSGETVVADIGKMPHMLIAGATGSGKSVCINTLIMSILYKARPDEVKLIMIDPKVVELSVYNGIPHLMIPVVTDPKQASEALKWGVVEMDDRYNKFAEFGVRDLNGYNKKVRQMTGIPEEDRYEVLPRIVIIVDELADLMMVASKEVEESICRIAQKARAAGIHLVIATQRPSVDVVTGLIKANMPSRIAFSVSSGVDSRTILDMVGAEKLLGKGDMLFYPQGYTKPARVQGAFVSDQEVNDVVDFLKEHSGKEGYDEEIAMRIKNASAASSSTDGGTQAGAADGRDELFLEAARAIIDKNKASIGMLQRLFKIGFNRAARIMDQLADAGVVGEEEGTKPRRVLMTIEEFNALMQEGNME
ncbi:MAG: DNA translocase FtsK [Lachnospiraceae bacterium]|nr:DNA translocase FtsK [Lachnospiraceae bacterium]